MLAAVRNARGGGRTSGTRSCSTSHSTVEPVPHQVSRSTSCARTDGTTRVAPSLGVPLRRHCQPCDRQRRGSAPRRRGPVRREPGRPAARPLLRVPGSAPCDRGDDGVRGGAGAARMAAWSSRATSSRASGTGLRSGTARHARRRRTEPAVIRGDARERVAGVAERARRGGGRHRPRRPLGRGSVSDGRIYSAGAESGFEVVEMRRR